MKDSDYWKERFELLEEATHKDATSVYHEIEEQYFITQKQLENQISSWYQRFATNNKVTMAEARKMLNAKELAELKWDVKEYIKYGEENAINGAWIKQLENASAKYHISRLEALKLQTQQSVEVLFENQTDDLDDLMKKIYSNGYYHTAYEIQKGFNIGWDIASIDQSKLEKIISKPWAADGKNFSDRIWTNKQSLISELHTQLTQTCILGKAPDDAIKNIAKKMNTSKNNAGRLVMTESAYFSSVSQKDCFNDLDVEQFEVVATLDSHTSAICQEMDGKVFPMKDYESGVTAPPFHVWCRSCTVPYFDDEWSIGERAARGEDGKTYYVPDNIKYKEWKKKIVNENLQKTSSSDMMKAESLASEKVGDTDGYSKIISIDKIEFGTEATKKALSEFIQKYSESTIEHAYILSPSNMLYHVVGTSSNVNTRLVGDDDLKGSISIHNHPNSDFFADSFSLYDFAEYFHDLADSAWLIAGEKKYFMSYHGEPISEETAKALYRQARNEIKEKAYSNNTEIKKEQLQIMLKLRDTLKGLIFFEE